jgi:hypothetical protein
MMQAGTNKGRKDPNGRKEGRKEGKNAGGDSEKGMQIIGGG